MGWVHDIQHTYEWSLYVLAGTCVIASVNDIVCGATDTAGGATSNAGAGGAAFEPLITQIGMMGCDALHLSRAYPAHSLTLVRAPFVARKGAGPFHPHTPPLEGEGAGCSCAPLSFHERGEGITVDWGDEGF